MKVKSASKRYKKSTGPKKNPKSFSLSRSEIKAKSEIKEIVAYVSGPIPVGGFISAGLTTIGQGQDINQRIGRVIQAVGVQVKYLSLGPSASIQNEFLRLIFLWDQQPNALTPIASDILDLTAGGGVTAFKNTKQYTDRFTFLKDIVIPVQNVSNATQSAADAHSHDEFYINLRGFPMTQYGSTVASVPTSGSLVYMIQSWKNTGATTTSGEMIMQVKFTYTDS